MKKKFIEDELRILTEEMNKVENPGNYFFGS
jgi:hypothetical protein